MDIAYLSLVLACFASAFVLLALCDRLRGGS